MNVWTIGTDSKTVVLTSTLIVLVSMLCWVAIVKKAQISNIYVTSGAIRTSDCIILYERDNGIYRCVKGKKYLIKR